MPKEPRRVRRVASLAVISLALSVGASAQGSPYLSLDDSRLLFLEHLIARGDIADPSPHVRPLLQGDVLIALRSAARDTTTSAGKIARELLRVWELPPSTAGWWRVSTTLGAQAYSQGRRDLLQPGGSAGRELYFDTGIAAVQGPLVAAVRPAFEPRLRNDPDYRRGGLSGALKDRFRVVDAYIAGQWRWFGVHSGQMQRNWGPPGLVGIPISNYAYPRTDIALSLGNRTLRYSVIRAPLYDVSVARAGTRRWFTAGRLDLRVGHGLDVALWEAGIVQRPSRALDAAIINPFFLVTFAPQFGLGFRRNTILGGDVTWRPTKRLLLQGQGAIDDMSKYASHPYPDRYGLSLLAAGALGPAMSWRASYVMNSSLAFTTADPSENFTDAQVGIGRNFIDNDQYAISLTIPLQNRWLVAPELQLLRQGEGSLGRPWPDSASATALPSLFIGTRRDTWQLALGVTGETSHVQLSALGGVQHSRNAGHIAGVSETRFVGRLQATISWRVGRADDLERRVPRARD